MIEIFDNGLQDYRALNQGEVLVTGDKIRETLPSGHVVRREYQEPSVIDINELYERRVKALYLHARAIIDEKESWYAKGEQYLWEELEAEVAAYQADNNVKGRNIAVREALGQTPAKQVTDNVTIASQLVLFVAVVHTNRAVHRDAMLALLNAPDLDGLLNYDYTTGWP